MGQLKIFALTSLKSSGMLLSCPNLESGSVAEGLGTGLQNRLHQFDSGRNLFFFDSIFYNVLRTLGNGQIGKAPDSDSGNSRFEP